MRSLLGLVLVVCVAAAAGAYVVYDRAHTPFRGYEGSERLIEIPSGLGTNAIGGRLIEAREAMGPAHLLPLAPLVRLPLLPGS